MGASARQILGKVYKVLITQTTGLPVIKVLKNTTGTNINWSNDGTGGYLGIPEDETLFANHDKVGCDIAQPINSLGVANVYINSDNYISITTALSGVPSDNLLFNTLLEITID